MMSVLVVANVTSFQFGRVYTPFRGSCAALSTNKIYHVILAGCIGHKQRKCVADVYIVATKKAPRPRGHDANPLRSDETRIIERNQEEMKPRGSSQPGGLASNSAMVASMDSP